MSKLEEESILNLVKTDPILFNNSKKIKRKLNLNCNPRTISNLLKRNNYKLHVLEDVPYLSEENLKMKHQFCSLVNNTNVQWSKVVFTDEKIVQSFNNQKHKAFRMRKRKGIGLDRR